MRCVPSASFIDGDAIAKPEDLRKFLTLRRFGADIQIHVRTMNVSHGAPVSAAKESQTIEILFTIYCELRKAHRDIIFAESILIPSEIDGYFKTTQWPPSLKSVKRYSSNDWAANQLSKAGAIDVDQYRLFVSDKLWRIFYTIRALYGRLGVHYHFSFTDGAYRDWRNDSGFASHVKALLGEADFEQFENIPFHGLSQILTMAETEFLKVARSDR